MFAAATLMGMAGTNALGQDEIEPVTLPTVEELAFPELSGDFDGDGAADRATARQSERGIEISIELSASGKVLTESLGAGRLTSVDWEVLEPDPAAMVCEDGPDCQLSARDAILITVNDETFILRWDGDAIETLFLDA
ncbi:MAG: hypothetical protein AAGG79_04040 [Pseudomonadota bacterium]